MRLLPTLALLLLPTLASAPILAGEPADKPTRQTLRGSDCLDPDLARGWHYLDSDTLLVDAGRRKYRIELRHSCTELGSAVAVEFRGDAISNRVCGNIGETVRGRRGMVCDIDRIELIDAETYRAASGKPGAAVKTTTGGK